MNCRIGGEFGISFDFFLQPLKIFNKTAYKKKFHMYLDTGRSALFAALTNIIQQGGNREAWLPYYCCDSVILPFRQLGFKINFYSMGGDLNTPNQLPKRLNEATFLFIHYFGKKNHAVLDWLYYRRLCASQSKRECRQLR